MTPLKDNDRRLKIRLEAEPSRLADWLVAHDYPLPWSLATLRDHCVILRVEAFDASPVSYVWANWIMPGVLDFHACADRRLWLSAELLTRLYGIAELFGAHSLLTTPHGDTAPTIRRLLWRHGFTREGAAMFKRLERPLGPLLGSENPDTDAAGGSSPS